ncbi:U7 snRNA-associated Sm-like protein LSm10 [Tamandua tetradactyla]|uniref:U7 snRNA-associated Sm-like protein LSm10 n=1 Tax=Tamandua tetradactyla TaxID=48850 RepID=UPI004053C6FA
MAVSHSVKEQTISENGLIFVLQGLQGEVTTVDLLDQSVARGRIDNTDAFMNIHLAQVTYPDDWGHQVEQDDLFVTGRNVHYVHILDDINIIATVEQQLIHQVHNFGGKGKGQGRHEFPSKRCETGSSAGPSPHSASTRVRLSQLLAQILGRERGLPRVWCLTHPVTAAFHRVPPPRLTLGSRILLCVCGFGVGTVPSSDRLHLNP